MARFKRASGVLLHPTALSGPYGIGSLGAHAVAFLDWLESAGQSYWQICPLVPTGYGDSPYQGFSAFAGNPNLIDLEELLAIGLLDDDDVVELSRLPDDHVDFEKLIPLKRRALSAAWRRFEDGENPDDMGTELNEFRRSAHAWIEDFALFMVLKERHNGAPWDLWSEEYRLRDEKTLEKVRSESSEELEYHVFVQYLFHRQWNALKRAASERGIRIIGDLPIFIAYDSSDCWSKPELFQLDAQGRPTRVAGVPPDYFSKTGQLWGNPLYDWDAMARNGYSWWISVLKNNLEHYDVLRIDHFRGFSAYWSVSREEKTAINGQWIPAPGKDLFSRVRQVMGDLPIIAEDLGVITDEVVELIDECGFPGMKVLQFAFDSSENNDYLPHNYSNHCLVYTGTHDNNTAAGWFEKAPESDRNFAIKYLNLPDTAKGQDVAAAMLHAAMASVSDLAVTPLQDILGLGSEARFNTPGTLGGNWAWRTTQSSLNADTAERLKELTLIFGRLSEAGTQS